MDDLLKSALVGTATQSVSSDSGHPADAVLDGLDIDPEHSLLLKAGVRAIWRQAGHVSRRDLPAMTPSPLEATPALSEKAVTALQTTLTGNSRELLPEFLTRLAATGRRLPPELLPEALTPVGRSTEVRNSIRAVLGERGRWLARLNPDWAWAAGEDVTAADDAALTRIWEEGSVAERIEAFSRLRTLNPTDARARLVEVIGKEKADARARLMDGLSTGLSIADEPFLEDVLGDRSESVRTVAAALLARLPASRLVARMTDRADAMLSTERGGLLKRKLKLVCTPPAEIDKEWLRDGVPKDTPTKSGRGKRAVWLETVLACVPPEHWTTRFDAAPAGLVVAAEADDFGDAILRGWTRSSITSSTGAAAWRLPLAEFWVRRATDAGGKKADPRELTASAGHLRDLFPRLDPPDADRLLSPLLEMSGGGNVERVGTPVLDMLAELPRPWSVALSRNYLRIAKQVFAEKRPRGYWWANTLPSAAAALAPETLGEALQVFAEPDDDLTPSPYRHSLDRFNASVRLRGDFLNELHVEP
ncbi:MAG: DUF5691 domain-containing protein [Planctomycetaceae bacterium]